MIRKGTKICVKEHNDLWNTKVYGFINIHAEKYAIISPSDEPPILVNIHDMMELSESFAWRMWCPDAEYGVNIKDALRNFNVDDRADLVQF